MRLHKKKVCEVIDAKADEIVGVAETIYKNPELGFREYATSEFVKSKFAELGLSYRGNLALTGVKARLTGRALRPTVAIMGEMDSIIYHNHPGADPATGAVHACGHNFQIAAMLGTAIGLLDSGLMKRLSGSVVLLATPAEEYIELDFRLRLRKEGKIEFLTGKQELIRLGEFDDIDMAMMVHAYGTPEKKVVCDMTMNGFIGKLCRFKGRAAHAGLAPNEGVNALNAAMLALMCIHAQRETFQEKDYVRIHGVMLKGGDSVNVVPADVEMAMYVRAKTIEAARNANEKVNRAIRAGAASVGANIEIIDMPGTMPLMQDATISNMFKTNMLRLLGPKNIIEGGHSCGSTDMGDVTQIMPAIHPSVGGFRGSLHSKEFEILDPEMACIIPAKAMAMTVIDLLCNEANLAEQVLKRFRPKVEKQHYSTHKRSEITNSRNSIPLN